jgi:hypothetical protein
LRRIAFLACGKSEADRAAETTHSHVDFGAQAAARTAKGLAMRAPPSPHILASLFRIVLAASIAIAAGIPLGLLMGLNRS